MNKAILLDRDGTINVDKKYVCRVEDFEFMPGGVDAMKRLYDAEYTLCVVTNQSGIGRGVYTLKDMRSVHDYMFDELKKAGEDIRGLFYCPHSPEENCKCRKPEAGLLELAIRNFDIDVDASYMIGDNLKDVEAGKRVGLNTIRVGDYDYSFADFCCKDLAEAVDMILG